MKKYLMMGLAALAIASCTKNDFEVTTADQIREAQYQQAFENQFGTINSNVNWGFENQTKVTFDSEGKFAGFTRGVSANGNEWGLYVDVPQPLTEAQKEVVTNWFKKNKKPQGIALNWSDFFVVHK